jgi:hypothetical protein
MCGRNTDIDILRERDVYLTKILCLQETYLRTHLFSNHFDHWISQGFEFDTSMKQEALKPFIIYRDVFQDVFTQKVHINSTQT